jgi:hypothetical protein
LNEEDTLQAKEVNESILRLNGTNGDNKSLFISSRAALLNTERGSGAGSALKKSPSIAGTMQASGS